MAIYLNGGSNPQRVTFNGTSLDSVWASVDDGATTTQVWGVSDTMPRNIGQVTGSKGSGLDLWIRDSTLTRAWQEIWAYDSSYHVFGEYSCDVTIEVDYTSRDFVARIDSSSTDFQFVPSTTAGSSVTLSGLPSGYKFSNLAASNTMNLDFYKTVDGSSSTIDSRIGVDMHINLNPTMFMTYGSTGITTSDYYYLYTANSGFIYQGPAVLRIEKIL